ncbi:MAG: hypothetical protein RQ767_06535 [Thermovirgaceae bacterium]|nr:hypothetical protein [Thermovirgaceae bacterium]
MAHDVSGGKPDRKVVLDDDSVERIADAVSRKPRAGARSFGEIISSGLGQISSDLKFHHKVIYALLVFLGLVLVWYGLWSIISVIPLLNKPFVALATGITVLVLTGAFFREIG